MSLDNAPLFRASASDGDPPPVQASPPRSQRSLLHRPRASSLEREPHGSAHVGEMAALKKQFAELQSQNQALQATVRSQQATIKQLQVREIWSRQCHPHICNFLGAVLHMECAYSC